MKLYQSFVTKSDCFAANGTIVPEGFILHSIGCPQPKAQPIIDNWNRPSPSYTDASGQVRKSWIPCAHAVVEPTGNAYQLLPWTMRGWHAGGSANNSYIGVEMTEPSCIKYTPGSATWTTTDMEAVKAHVKAVYQPTVEIFALLCKQFKKDPLKDGVILSHAEAHARGIASGHSDPEHLWKAVGLTMNQFRQDVANFMKGVAPKPPVQAPAAKTIMTVTTALNLRKGPSTATQILKVMPKGKKVEVLEKTAGSTWWKISVDGVVGYTSHKFLI